jgi:PAS domain S-box-containing protein
MISDVIIYLAIAEKCHFGTIVGWVHGFSLLVVEKMKVNYKMQDHDEKENQLMQEYLQLREQRSEIESKLVDIAKQLKISDEAIIDITRRKRFAEIFQKFQQELEIRNKIADAFLTSSDEDVYGKVVNIIVDVAQSEYGILGYVNEDGDIVCPDIAKYSWENQNPSGASMVFSHKKAKIWAKAIAEKKAIFLNTASNLPDGHISISRVMVIPIIHHDEAIGLIAVANKQDNYDERDGELIGTIANYIAPILGVRLQRDRQESASQKAESALRESEVRYRTIFESSFDAILAVTPDGEILSANPACAKILGYDSVDEIIGESMVKSCYIPEDCVEFVKEVIKNGYVKNYELTLLKNDGTPVYVISSATLIKDEQGNTTRIDGSFKDITERKLAEEKLQKSEQLYRSAIEAAGAVPYCRNYETNGYEFVGNNIKALTGYSSEEFSPETWDSIIIEEIPSGKYAGLTTSEARHKTIDDNEPNWWFDVHIKTRDGKEKWLLDASVQMRDDTGRLLKTLGIIQDISDRKSSEEKLQESNRLLEEALSELRKTQQQIIQQERLRALGQLASGIAHDFNNALMPILGYSDLLLTVPDILSDREKSKKFLEAIKVSSEDAKDVVDRLREFYRNRTENDVFNQINLNYLVKQVVSLTMLKWKDQALSNGVNIRVLTDLGDIPFIKGIEAELREVLTNLIFNSVDAINTNGDIILQTRSEGNKVLLKVIDTGSGMTEDVLNRCFEPFFSTKGENGTGLGLSVIHGIIRRHNGTIEAKSELGQGTTFSIYLPSSEYEQSLKKEQKAHTISKSLHVLVVDDEPVIQDIIGEFLTKDGHTYELANNGREGLIKFKSSHFDLIVTDKAMPDIGGDQLATLIRQISPEIPIIMLTGFGNIMNSAGEMPNAVDCVLGKPLKLQDFRNAVRETIRKKQKR